MSTPDTSPSRPTLGRLALNGLRFHARSYLGVFLGAMLATAIITGALAVGDSVRHSLRRMAAQRLQGVHLALHNGGLFFREALAMEVATDLKAPVAPVLLLRGTATGQRADGSGGEVRVNRVQVVGVTETFWKLGNTTAPNLKSADGDGLALNDHLAKRLNLRPGDEVILRVNKPSLMNRDAPLSKIEDATVTLRLPVTAVVTSEQFGRFSLEANQVPPENVFVPLRALQTIIGMEAKANTLLVGGGEKGGISAAAATETLWKHWQFADAGLNLRPVANQSTLELRTDRVFLDPGVGEAARKAYPNSRGVLTYFVNELRRGTRATPYSTVAALDGPTVPAGMQVDEVIINRWLADDLQAKAGDSITLSYWLVGPMRRLEEKQSTFRVRQIVPLDGVYRDPALMPDIPGLTDKKDCREWEPGVPVALDRIRDKDQAYWSAYRGTPKAFIRLSAGQRIWNNRFGNLTAVRYPLTGVGAEKSVETCLRQALSPASLGLFFIPVRQQAQAASGATFDFGQLFIGFSVFLIVAALLLTALLFAFGVEQRTEEVGILLALGFTPQRVRGLLLLEGVGLALLAGIGGAALATFYTRAVVGGLSTVWAGAVADAALGYFVEPTTLVVGAVAGFVMALWVIYLVARRQARIPARVLLAGVAETENLAAEPIPRRSPGIPLAILLLAGAIVCLVFSRKSEESAGLFFGAGACLLLGGLAACHALLGQLARRIAGRTVSLIGLGWRNTARRPGRSLSAIALFASGSFLIVAVGANRHDAAADAEKRSSGTGGFALYAESTLPVYQDLNADEGRDAFALDGETLKGATVVPFRLREGDEASCLNLNRAQTPRLLGVPVQELARRQAFTFAQKDKATPPEPWQVLDLKTLDGSIPVVGDINTVVWSLGKNLGDTLPYTDDRGNTYRLRIVGILANSVLQGSLLVSEERFIELFPTQSGYQVFLVDAPSVDADAVSRELTQGLEEVGLGAIPTGERLAAFNMVENTYLSIFAALGGLGLILGSVGLGILVLRNVWERRAELAVLRALGFRNAQLYALLFQEHVLLLALGLAVGVVSALVAVWPSLQTPGTEIPYISLTMTLVAVFLNGLLWPVVATLLALRLPLLPALRNE